MKIINIIIVLLAFMSLLISVCKQTNNEFVIEDYIVQSGDTLWSIATTYKEPGQDIREYIYDIQVLNNIDCIIYPGQIIKIIK